MSRTMFIKDIVDRFPGVEITFKTNISGPGPGRLYTVIYKGVTLFDNKAVNLNTIYNALYNYDGRNVQFNNEEKTYDAKLYGLVDKVIFNHKNGVTTVLFKDGDKVWSKVPEGTEFCEYQGLTACLSKKAFGTNSDLNRMVRGAQVIKDTPAITDVGVTKEPRHVENSIIIDEIANMETTIELKEDEMLQGVVKALSMIEQYLETNKKEEE